MSDLLKNKLLIVATTGTFTKFPPATLYKYKVELTSFLASSPLVSAIELYTLIELQFYLCILTKDDVQAEKQLKLILDKFELNKKSQRIKFLQSIYYEAIGELTQSRELLSQDADEIRLSRRLLTLTRNEDDPQEYIKNLNFYLTVQPSDIPTWAELGDEYFKVGHYDEAIFCYKEILMHEPVAYHYFYKTGLTSYYKYLQVLKTAKKEHLLELLIHLRNNYLRCIEIFDGHKESWLGIQILSKIPIQEKSPLAKTYLAEGEKLLELSEKKLISLGV